MMTASSTVVDRHSAEFISDIRRICEQAHAIILPYWQNESALGIETKDDDSPVTLADKAANALIVAALAKLTPNIPIISEEGDQPPLGATERFWLVDPLDGTKGFIRGTDAFTVNIGLIENGYPVFGMLGVPAQRKLYYGGVGQGAHCSMIGEEGKWRAIKTNAVLRSQPQKLIASHSHRSPKLEEWVLQNGIQIAERIHTSSALKYALVAEGTADLYPRFGPTMEWDSAAGQAIVEAAGGVVTDLQGNRFAYGKPGYLNGGFIVWGGH